MAITQQEYITINEPSFGILVRGLMSLTTFTEVLRSLKALEDKYVMGIVSYAS